MFFRNSQLEAVRDVVGRVGRGVHKHQRVLASLARSPYRDGIGTEPTEAGKPTDGDRCG